MTDERGNGSGSGWKPRLPKVPGRPGRPEELRRLRQFCSGRLATTHENQPSAGKILRPVWIPELENVAEASHSSAILGLLGDTARARFSSAHSAFVERLEPLLRELRLLLKHHRQHDPDPSALDHGLGQLASRFVDTGALASRLRSRSQAPTADRIGRIEDALGTLEGAAAGESEPPRLLCQPLVADRLGLSSADSDWITRWQVELDPDPCARAAERFDDVAARTARPLAAWRVARLELEAAYDAETHDAGLAAFDWQSFQLHELELLPPVVAVVSQESVAGSAMVPLSRLLRSGRPVQIVVIADSMAADSMAADPMGADPIDEHVPSSSEEGLPFGVGEFGLSHRGAFVHQGSWACPSRLQRGFERGLQSTRTALHIVEVPPPEGSGDRSSDRARAAIGSRAHPLFVFDPEGGNLGEDPVELTGNPQVDSPWPSSELDVEGSADSIRFPFTFADRRLLESSRSGEFLPVADDLQDATLVSLPDWLELGTEKARQTIPFVWALDQDSVLHRLAVGRALAVETRDCLERWRILQRLAGQTRSKTRETLPEKLAPSAPETTPPERAAPERVAPERVALASGLAQTETDVIQRLVRALLAEP